MIDILDDQPSMIRLERLYINYIVMLRVTRPCIASHLIANTPRAGELHATVDRLLTALDLVKKIGSTRTTTMSKKEFFAEQNFKINFLINELCMEYPGLSFFLK
jgi:hypothetical protein